MKMLRDCIEFNILNFSTADVLSEDTIIKWYKEAHSVKGKSVFLEQMSKFIEWLQNAEEGNEDLIYLVKPTLTFIIYYCF